MKPLPSIFTAVLLQAFGLEALATPSKKDRPLRIAIFEMPTSLDPHRGNFPNENKITKQLFDSLTAFDASGYPVPALSKKWVINRIKKSLVFTLDEAAQFTDGTRLTSKIVKDSLVRSLNNKNQQLFDYILNAEQCSSKYCASIEELSDGKLKIYLKNSNFDLFLRAMAGTEGSIILIREDNFIGTGPFQVTNSTKDEIVLKRKVPSDFLINEIIYRHISLTDAKVKFLNSQIDELWNSTLSEEDIRQRAAQKIEYAFNGTFLFVPNLTKGIFSNVSARKALTLAIDPKEILESFQIKGNVATGIIPDGSLGHTASRVVKNLEVAKDLIANLPNSFSRTVKATFHLSYKEKPAFERYLKSVFAAIGLNLEIHYADFYIALKGLRESRYDLTAKADSYQYYDTSTIFIPLLTDNPANVNHYHNPKLDALIYQSQITQDPIEKGTFFQAAENLIAEEVPVIPIFYPIKQSYYSSDLALPLNPKNEILYWEFPYRYFRWKN